MGLIKAAMGAAGGVMADQWKEFSIVMRWIRYIDESKAER